MKSRTELERKQCLQRLQLTKYCYICINVSVPKKIARGHPYSKIRVPKFNDFRGQIQKQKLYNDVQNKARINAVFPKTTANFSLVLKKIARGHPYYKIRSPKFYDFRGLKVYLISEWKSRTKLYPKQCPLRTQGTIHL